MIYGRWPIDARGILGGRFGRPFHHHDFDDFEFFPLHHRFHRHMRRRRFW